MHRARRRRLCHVHPWQIKTFFWAGLVTIVLMLVGTVALPIDNKVEAQNVENFHFSGFEADYYLSKDEEGRSRLRVVEKLTAEFPEFDQNKGIIRVIPVNYDGHPLSFELQSVTRNGQAEPVYDQVRRNNNIEISLGTDDYVHGTHVYEMTYTMRDVIRDFDEYQEFFWDTNGTQWRQHFDQLSARVHLDEYTRELFTGEAVCYEGPQGSIDRCPWRADGDTVIFESNSRLKPGDNLSMLMKFEAGAFEPFREGLIGIVRNVLAAAMLVFAVAAVALSISLRLKNRNAPGKGVIVPEYQPPEGISLLLASCILGKSGVAAKSIPAQIIDLAVRGKVKIIETSNKILFFKSKKYQIEFRSANNLSQEESEVLDAFFGQNKTVGQRYDFGAHNYNTAYAIRNLQRQLADSVVNLGYRRKVKGVILPYILIGAAVLLMIVVAVLLNRGSDSGLIIIPYTVTIPALFLVVLLLKNGIRPLTPEGKTIVDHLKGLESYIKLAEAERLKVLQSPAGARKTPVDTNDQEQIVKLYEKLLPYAVLFGLEKEWLKQLGTYYEQQQAMPSWYAGAAGFNAAALATSVSSFSASTSSSSSGFSGGGSSGGGGGGGGGGGR